MGCVVGCAGAEGGRANATGRSADELEGNELSSGRVRRSCPSNSLSVAGGVSVERGERRSSVGLARYATTSRADATLLCSGAGQAKLVEFLPAGGCGGARGEGVSGAAPLRSTFQA